MNIEPLSASKDIALTSPANEVGTQSQVNGAQETANMTIAPSGDQIPPHGTTPDAHEYEEQTHSTPTQHFYRILDGITAQKYNAPNGDIVMQDNENDDECQNGGKYPPTHHEKIHYDPRDTDRWRRLRDFLPSIPERQVATLEQSEANLEYHRESLRLHDVAIQDVRTSNQEFPHQDTHIQDDWSNGTTATREQVDQMQDLDAPIDPRSMTGPPPMRFSQNTAQTSQPPTNANINIAPVHFDSNASALPSQAQVPTRERWVTQQQLADIIAQIWQIITDGNKATLETVQQIMAMHQAATTNATQAQGSYRTDRLEEGSVHSSHSAQSIQELDYKMKVNKAFKSVLTAPAVKFDGHNKLAYTPWKDALMREVEGLELTDAQWLDLLYARTSNGALDALQPAMIIQQECSAREALLSALPVLKETYYTPQRPSQHLVQRLLYGPAITPDKPEDLFTFASCCEATLFMKQRNVTAFASLDEHNTQQVIFERLSHELKTKWCEHRWIVLQSEVAPFEEFVKWIKGQAMIHRFTKAAEPSTPVRQFHVQQAREEYAPTQLNPSWMYQSQFEQPSHVQNINAPEFHPHQSQSCAQQDQQPSDYPDAVRVMTTLTHRQPQTAESLTSRIMPVMNTRAYTSATHSTSPACVWCTEHKKQHNHATINCKNFKNASPHEQWKVTNKHRTCKTCLSDAHALSQCPMKRKHWRCQMCQYTHSKVMGCCPSTLKQTGPSTSPSPSHLQQSNKRNRPVDIRKDSATFRCTTETISRVGPPAKQSRDVPPPSTSSMQTKPAENLADSPLEQHIDEATDQVGPKKGLMHATLARIPDKSSESHNSDRPVPESLPAQASARIASLKYPPFQHETARFCVECAGNARTYNHDTATCFQFAKLTTEQQWELVQQYALCQRCLRRRPANGDQWMECPCPSTSPDLCDTCPEAHRGRLNCKQVRPPLNVRPKSHTFAKLSGVLHPGVSWHRCHEASVGSGRRPATLGTPSQAQHDKQQQAPGTHRDPIASPDTRSKTQHNTQAASKGSHVPTLRSLCIQEALGPL